jgi:DHA3 family macrolide efflux protein-like MFS transporter
MRWKKNAALFLTGQGLSLFGSMLVQYAISWYITLKTGSGKMLTVFIIAGILPMFFISPFAGVWADRFNRKYLINMADAAIALATLAVAIFFFMGHENIWLLLVCAGIRALGQGVQIPAIGAFLPQITPQEHLARVNGINGSIQGLTMLLSPMLSALLLSAASIKIIFFIDVITAAIGISIVFFLVRPENTSRAAAGENPAETRKSTGYFHDLAEGFRYIKKHPYILILILLSIFFFIAASPTAFLTPLHVTRKFGPEVWRLGALEIAFSSGMMIGGLLIGAWGGFKNRVYSMAFSCALFGLEAIALGLLNQFWPYITVMGLMGLTMPLYNTPSMTMLQSRVESAYLGRVLSVFGMVSSLMMPAGMLIFGPLADFTGISILLTVTGAVILCITAGFFLKPLREAGKPPETPHE